MNAKERNKLIAALILAGIAVLALYSAFSTPVAPPAPSAKPGATSARSNALQAIENPRLASRPSGAKGAAKGPAGPIDPKLRLDLLQKSAGVTYEPGTGRNVFAYGPPPPPPAPKPLPQPKFPPIGPGQGPGGSSGSMPTVIAPPPPIPLKYFGYANKPNDPVKRAFLAEGEEIYIAGEGEIVNKRYRIVKIGVNTVEIEDTVTKSKQVLPLQENP